MISDQKHNSSISFEEIKRELFAVADEKKREFLPYFFKTGEGQYGAGDQFIGVVVPKQRAIVKKYHSLPLNEIELLLEDAFHECRMTGLFFLFDLAKLLLTHPHDLIQKAVGWMLREIGKRDFEAEIEFLSTEQRYQQMPRTMLRYAIERFPENLRQQFLKNEI